MRFCRPLFLWIAVLLGGLPMTGLAQIQTGIQQSQTPPQQVALPAQPGTLVFPAFPRVPAPASPPPAPVVSPPIPHEVSPVAAPMSFYVPPAPTLRSVLPAPPALPSPQSVANQALGRLPGNLGRWFSLGQQAVQASQSPASMQAYAGAAATGWARSALPAPVQTGLGMLQTPPVVSPAYTASVAQSLLPAQAQQWATTAQHLSAAAQHPVLSAGGQSLSAQTPAGGESGSPLTAAVTAPQPVVAEPAVQFVGLTQLCAPAVPGAPHGLSRVPPATASERVLSGSPADGVSAKFWVVCDPRAVTPWLTQTGAFSHWLSHALALPLQDLRWVDSLSTPADSRHRFLARANAETVVGLLILSPTGTAVVALEHSPTVPADALAGHLNAWLASDGLVFQAGR